MIQNMRASLYLLLISVLAIVTAGAQTSLVPELIPVDDPASVEPYAYNGVFRSGFGSASGSIVHPRVVATASHVIFDESKLEWIPAGNLEFYRAHNQRLEFFGSSADSITMANTVRWDSYAGRIEEIQEHANEGRSSIDAFNLDFATAYWIQTPADGYDHYPEVHVDPEEEIGILRDQRENLILGYPQDNENVPMEDHGFMHQTPPGDYFAWWVGFTDEEDSWYDSEGRWISLYDVTEVTTYSGNSGGGVYSRDAEGNWVFVGVVVGSDDLESILVRSVDEEGMKLIEAAAAASGAYSLKRVEDLEVQEVNPGQAVLTWSDNASSEAYYRIWRKSNDDWEVHVEIPANRETYLDEVEPGSVYAYEIQAVGTDENRAPRSNTARLETRGVHRVAAETLDPLLFWQSRGETTFYPVEEGLRSGKVRSMGHSNLEVPVIGPGTVTFEWRVSSERNEEFDDPSSDVHKEIYDAFYFYIEPFGEKAEEHEAFISGEWDPEELTFEIPEGPHTLRWEYRKDPYTQEGEDAGFLREVSWTPEPGGRIVPGAGQVDSRTRVASWWGFYTSTNLPWTWHYEWGWLYLQPAGNRAFWAYSSLSSEEEKVLGHYYVHPSHYPYVYVPGMGGWVYYYQDSGLGGKHVWTYDFQNREFVVFD